jgi:predicted esterase
VEQFTLDVVDAAGLPAPGPVLVGVGQGAVLALAAAKVLPDYLGGVIAVDGYLPRIPGLELPIDDLSGLPVLMINNSGSPTARLGAESAARMAREGARVETDWGIETSDLGERRLTDVVAEWSSREIRPRITD